MISKEPANINRDIREKELASFYRDSHVLITGGLGFIGSNLAIELIKLGAQVTIVDSMIPQYGGNLFNIQPIREKVQINISDVRDRSSMNYLVQGQDMLFNLAGTLSHIDSMKDPFVDLEINCQSQLSILESCRQYNPGLKLVFAGTRGQYGRTGSSAVTEDFPMRPADVNGINNIAGESYHLLYNDVYGIRACSLRLTNTFGPRHQMRHPRQGVLNWFLRQFIEGKPIRLFGSGNQVRDTNYVSDVVEAFLLAMMLEETNGKAYNLGGEPLSLKQFIELAIAENEGGSFEFEDFPAENEKIEIGDYIADWSLFNRTCGWSPRTNVRSGIRATLEFYRECREHYW
jgi:nucleoside-diphosphate-sugar epimerase